MIRPYLLSTADASRWRAVLPAETCVMGSVEYARIVERHTGCAARLWVAGTDRAAVAYPYFLRPVDSLPFAAGAGGARFDTFTPEYTGPLALDPGPAGELRGPRLADLFARHCREQGIVAEFAHLSPWHRSAELVDPAFVAANRDVVYLDLTVGEQRTWSGSLTSNARRMARQAREAGVRVRHASSPQEVLEFHRLHTFTMRRRRALERYFLPPEYFLALFETMRESAFFALAEYRGRLVAGGLFLHDGSDVYWQLSAADLQFANVRPVNGYVWETIRWAVEHGKARMLLGGGYAPEDGVFRFKTAFSPLRARFCTYRRIHDSDAYASLVRAWSAHHGGRAPGTGYFPAYRAE